MMTSWNRFLGQLWVLLVADRFSIGFLDDVIFDRSPKSAFSLPSFSTEFYWILLGFTGFYWVLLGFTGFFSKWSARVGKQVAAGSAPVFFVLEIRFFPFFRFFWRRRWQMVLAQPLPSFVTVGLLRGRFRGG